MSFDNEISHDDDEERREQAPDHDAGDGSAGEAVGLRGSHLSKPCHIRHPTSLVLLVVRHDGHEVVLVDLKHAFGQREVHGRSGFERLEAAVDNVGLVKSGRVLPRLAVQVSNISIVPDFVKIC